jgi:hypothetical protein
MAAKGPGHSPEWGGRRPGAGRPPKSGERRVSVGVNLPPGSRDFLTALVSERGESRSETLTKLLDSLSDACGEWLDESARDWDVNRVRALEFVLSDYGRLLADDATAGTLRAVWDEEEDPGS